MVVSQGDYARMKTARANHTQGGDLHWIWKPYALYMNVRHLINFRLTQRYSLTFLIGGLRKAAHITYLVWRLTPLKDLWFSGFP
jgi:hypothetical protein